MNCQEFSTIVGELASISLMDAARRETALAHCEQCSRCAKRLADERALVSGFRELIAADVLRGAPVDLEDGLRVAFRQQMAVAEVESAPGLKRQYSRFLWVAAAILIATVGASSAMLLLSRNNDLPSTQTGSLEKSAFKHVDLKEASRPQQIQTPAPGHDKDRLFVNRRQMGGRSMVARHRKSMGRTSTAESSVTVSIGGFAPIPAVSNDAEIATDFVPLLASIGSPPVDNGQVIRVQMPRAALASFGLPFNLERANESVKADVLLGEDGLARAIRFVH